METSGEARPSDGRHSYTGVFVLLCAISAVEGMDWMLLPTSLKAWEVELGIGPSDLAILSTGGALAMALFGPVWGVLTDRGTLSRGSVLCGGCVAWGVFTGLLGAVNNNGRFDFYYMVLLRTLTGAALACLNPIAQSLVAATAKPADRGARYGWLTSSMFLGQVACSLGVTPISRMEFMGYTGWRWAFWGVGALSVLLGIVVSVAFVDPMHKGEALDDEDHVRFEASRLIRYFRLPTFAVIVVQGLVGSVPWNALTFQTMYFQMAGLSDAAAGAVATAGLVALCVGTLAGGFIGDFLERAWPVHGRPLTAQLTVALGIPFVWLTFWTVRTGPAAVWEYCALYAAFNLLASWCDTGAKRPILSQIVAPHDRGSIFAWDTAFEHACAALLGAPVVALLATNVFGYELKAPGADAAADPVKAEALGRAMMWVCTVPFAVCFLIMSVIHFTLPSDLMRRKSGPEIPLEDTPLLDGEARA